MPQKILIQIESNLSYYLGEASTIGASSWLHALTWIAALVVAICAWLSIRRQSLQSRASLHLNLYQQWDQHAENRQIFHKFMHPIKEQGIRENANKNADEQLEKIRIKLKIEFNKLRSDDAEKFDQCVRYIGFFEIIGAYVVKGYLPLGDVVSLYKGPILDLELASKNFITEWQSDAHMPDGLLANARFLMETVRYREDHRMKHFLTFRFSRLKCKYFKQ